MRLPRFIKRSLQSDWARRLASRAIAAYIGLVYKTSRWRRRGWTHFEQLEEDSEGFILAFWHRHLMMAPTARGESAKPVYMLVSNHRDGEIIAKAAAPFGVRFIRGSSANQKKKFKDKSGAPALVQMIAALNEGAIVGVTPDGPRGPRQKAQMGVIRLAQLAGAPILPAACLTSRRLELKTWDRFCLPLPFSRGAYVVGAPIAPPRTTKPTDLAAAREALECSLNNLSDEAMKTVQRNGETASDASPDAASIR